MSKTNGVAPGTLRPATQDEVALVEAVRERLLGVCHLHRREMESDLCPTVEVRPAYDRWRRVVARHRAGDFRISRDEVLATREVAQWSLDVNCALRNQPFEKIEWRD